MVSLAEVAKRAGVGTGTASRALSGRGSVDEATRQRVLVAAEELRYRGNAAARALRERRSRMVGLLLPDLDNEFYTAAAEVLQSEVAAAGYQLIVAQTSTRLGDERRAWESMLRSGVDGVVHVPVDPSAPVPTELPVVQLNRRSDDGEIPAVLTNDAEGVEQLTRLVLEAGHRDIALLVGSLEYSTSRERLEGFRRAIRAAGIREVPIVDPPPGARARVVHADLSIEAGIAAFALLEGDAPTAVLALNSRLLLGVLASCQRRGLRVPEDVSIAGMGDPVWYAVWSPAITTFSPPLAEMGRRAGREILALIEHGDDRDAMTPPVRLAGELIIRDSIVSR
ncbi:LacI family DNA-binding transcriptional regulator [Microbacterium sp. RD1]|uniref:LacI family DNA-binding transcriptional regulator n=1 Tax=Microbacterium sp. RD1 TaxID=3457313 RepID=UPI003FA5DDD7